MEFDKILTAYNKVNKKLCLLRLSKLGNDLFERGKWSFTQTYSSEIDAMIFGEFRHVSIGKLPLILGCDDTQCNKAGYVYVIKDMYHEAHHIWMDDVARNDTSNLHTVKQYRQITDIVRHEFIRSYFPSVYTNNYSNDIGEMNAEAYGIRQALAHFNSDPIVTKPEAEEILYRLITSEDYVHHNLMEANKDRLKTIHDVIDLFEERARNNDVTYEVTMDIRPDFKDDPDIDLTMTDKFLHDKAFKEYRKAFAACRTGTEQDKVLEQVILLTDEDAMKHVPLRLKDELKECRKQMELDTLLPGVHALPPNRIHYSGHGLPNEGLVLTEEDLARIPINGDMSL